MGARERNFQAALTEHGSAIEAFRETAQAIAAEDWRRPLREGKWSPCEITEHVGLSLEAVRKDLVGESAMRYRLSAWKRWTLRRLVLPRLLRTGRFPSGVRAPREVRPSESDTSREQSLERLRAAAA